MSVIAETSKSEFFKSDSLIVHVDNKAQDQEKFTRERIKPQNHLIFQMRRTSSVGTATAQKQVTKLNMPSKAQLQAVMNGNQEQISTCNKIYSYMPHPKRSCANLAFCGNHCIEKMKDKGVAESFNIATRCGLGGGIVATVSSTIGSILNSCGLGAASSCVAPCMFYGGIGVASLCCLKGSLDACTVCCLSITEARKPRQNDYDSKNCVEKTYNFVKKPFINFSNAACGGLRDCTACCCGWNQFDTSIVTREDQSPAEVEQLLVNCNEEEEISEQVVMNSVFSSVNNSESDMSTHL